MALKLNLPQNSRLLHSPRVFFFDFSPYLYLNITLNRYFELPNRRRLYWKIKKNLNNEKNVILLVCFETYWTKDFNKQRNATKFTIITLSSRYLYRLQISLLPFHLVFIRQNLFQHSPSAATISPHVRAHMLHGRTHAYAGTHAYICACVRAWGGLAVNVDFAGGGRCQWTWRLWIRPECYSSPGTLQTRGHCGPRTSGLSADGQIIRGFGGF